MSSSVSDDLLKNVPGFGRCPQCPYLQNAAATLCLTCARREFDALAVERCPVCDLGFKHAGDTCRNPVCRWSDRWFQWNRSIALKTRQLEDTIKRLKYDGKTGWAKVFGRVLAGFLDAERAIFESFDLIVASPFFATPERPVGHVRLIVRAAAPHLAAGPWEFDLSEPAAIVKTGITESMARKAWRKRHEIATGCLRGVLHVPDPSRTRERSILVVDDVFTSGHTLNEVARALRTRGGATRVCGVTLSRQHFTARP